VDVGVELRTTYSVKAEALLCVVRYVADKQ